MTPVTSPGATPSDRPQGVPGCDGDAAAAGQTSGAHRFRRIFETAPFALCLANRQGELRICNQAFRDLFGLTEEDCRGLTFRDVTHPADLDESRLRFRELWDGETPSALLESRYRHRSGQIFWAQTSMYLLRAGRDEPLGSVAMLTDITKRKRAESERLRQAEELAHSRTAAENEAARLERVVHDLETARSNAEAATKQMGEFLAVMSHEIRTPMNGVIGMTDLLLQTELKSDQRELVETIRTSGESLLFVINDILDFSKIESGSIELEQEPFEIRQCIEAAMSLVAPRAATKGLDVAYLVEEHVPDVVTGDILRLRQILVNLLSNAIKFTDEGEVVLTVGHVVEGGVERLQFSVRDTGIGIPDDLMDKLFKSFSQIDASTERKYGGTGLGLVISMRLTEILGGKMWAESAVNTGSTFHFTIEFEKPTFVPSPALPDVAGCRVLVVDRHETTCTMLRQQLESYGLVVTTTTSGADALEQLETTGFDLALIEADLPELGPPTLARITAQASPSRGVPVAFLHRLGQHVDVQGIEAAGLIAKPVKHRALQHIIARTLDRNSDSTPPAPASTDALPTMDNVSALRVLLAEDNPVNQKVAARMLGKLGYEADVAANGVEALRKLETGTYDVVLMDIMMPEMDGMETTRRIIERYPPESRPRIIALTANAMRGDRERCLDAGMDDYLAKPLRVDRLKESLAACATVRAGDEQPEENALAGEKTLPPGGEAAGGDGADVAVGPVVPSVDLRVLEEMKEMMGGSDPDFLSDIIAEFLEDSAGLMDAIRASIRERSSSGLHYAAHTLKSSSAMFGASGMAATCKELERVGAESRLTEAGSHLEVLERQYATVIAELTAHIART